MGCLSLSYRWGDHLDTRLGGSPGHGVKRRMGYAARALCLHFTPSKAGQRDECYSLHAPVLLTHWAWWRQDTFFQPGRNLKARLKAKIVHATGPLRI